MTDHELDEMMNAFCGMGPAMARMKAAEAKWDTLVPAGAVLCGLLDPEKVTRLP